MKRTIMAFLSLALVFVMGGCGTDTSAGTPTTGTGTGNETNASPAQAQESEAPAEKTEEDRYSEALNLLKSEDYAGAITILRDLGDYNDSKSLLREAAYSSTKKYVNEKGQSFKPLADAETSYDKTVFMDVADKTQAYIAINKDDKLVLGSTLYDKNEYTTMLEDFSIILESGKNIASANDIAGTVVLDAYIIEGGTGTLDLSKYTKDTEPDYTTIVYSNRKTGETNVTEKEITRSECMILGKGIMADTRGYAVSSVDNLLKDIGVTAYDLGFDTFKPAASSSSSTASASGSGTANSGDGLYLATDKGTVKYAGWEYAPEGLYTKTDKDHAVLVYFEYTNLEDDEKQMQSDFWVRAYQNGVELDDPGSHYTNVSEELANYFKTVLQNGTIRVACGFKITDDSPLTIIVNEQGNSDNKVKMEINLK